MSSCYFIGHREASRQILPSIIHAAEKLIQTEQVNCFFVGGYGCFDSLAGEAVMQLKKTYRSIQLFLVIPYHPADRSIKTPSGYDGTFYPDGMESVPRRYAISKANRKVIDRCDWLIAYVNHTGSNSCKMLEYAKRREKMGIIHVVNLGENNRLL